MTSGGVTVVTHRDRIPRKAVTGRVNAALIPMPPVSAVVCELTEGGCER